MISFGTSLRRIYTSAFGLRLAIGRDEANLSWRGNIIAAVLLGRREAHCEQVVIRGHNTLGDSVYSSLYSDGSFAGRSAKGVVEEGVSGRREQRSGRSLDRSTKQR